MMRSDAGSSGSSSEELKYKGVRKRKWGKWVSEVRLPNSRDRIWLGSYDSPEKAARAFDAATFCLRGRKARLNFPDNPPQIPFTRSMTHQQIQMAATNHAHSVPTEEVTAIETTAATSPVVSTSEASGEVAMAATMTDWPYMDSMTEDFSMMNEYYGYDFMPLTTTTTGPPPEREEEEEEGDNGFGTKLWTF